jgi:TonB family protein
MQLSFCLAVASVVVSLGGCASGDAQSSSARDKARRRSTYNIVAVPDDDNSGMQMQMSIGYLDERAVDRAMAGHHRAMARCFDRAGDARKYLSGEITLKFMVAADGSVTDVHVVKNDLGNYAVERCLVATGKQIRMPRPEGNQATDFQFPIQFRSTGEVPVLDWSGDEVSAKLDERAAELNACGSLGPLPVQAVTYTGGNGTVDSVGLVSEGPIDPTAGACAVEQFGRLRVLDSRPNMELRAVVPVQARAESKRIAKRTRRR